MSKFHLEHVKSIQKFKRFVVASSKLVHIVESRVYGDLSGVVCNRGISL